MTETVVTMRRVLVYSTQGKKAKEVLTDAQTWGALQSALNSNDITHNKMKAVVGESKVTLESQEAMLPAQNFTLYLMPKKTKSGTDYKNMPYKECRSTIKAIIDTADDVDKAKKFFSVDGKNYTQTSTDNMRKNLAKWNKKNTISSKVIDAAKKIGSKVKKEKVEEEVVEKVKEIVGSVKESKEKVEEKKEDIHAFNRPDSINVLVDNLEKCYVNMFTEEEHDKFIKYTYKLRKLEQKITNRLQREAEKELEKEKLKKLEKELDAEAKDLMKEFDDVSNY